MVYSNPDIIERICGSHDEEEVFDHVWGPTNVDTKSSIQTFYEGSSIFVTGGSGFIGMALVEKLLRSCPGIKNLYLLMRKHKGKTVEERTNDIFLNPIFVPLLMKRPNILDTVKIIPGNLEERNLGISPSNINILKKEVNIVFHVAATIRFDEHLRKAFQINVVSLKDLLTLAESMKNLKAFVHVSTAFCQTHLGKHIKEKFYRSPYTEEEMEAILTADDYAVGCLSGLFLGNVPNTYNLTKAIAEDLIRQKVGKLPLAIYRPGIVLNTHDEPIHGWINTYQGAGALFVGFGLGFLRIFRMAKDKRADMLPADKCVNALATLPWYTYVSRKEKKELTPIYQHLMDNVTWAEASTVMCEDNDTREIRSKSQVWACHIDMDPNKFTFGVKSFLYHLVPLPIFILAEKWLKQPPRLQNAYIKLYHVSNQLSTFTLENWVFEDKNLREMWSHMSELDQRLFRFDVKHFDWKEYVRFITSGTGIYVLDDHVDNLKRSRSVYNKMVIADKMLLYPMKGLILWIAFKIGVCFYHMLKHYIENQINRI